MDVFIDVVISSGKSKSWDGVRLPRCSDSFRVLDIVFAYLVLLSLKKVVPLFFGCMLPSLASYAFYVSTVRAPTTLNKLLASLAQKLFRIIDGFLVLFRCHRCSPRP